MKSKGSAVTLRNEKHYLGKFRHLRVQQNQTPRLPEHHFELQNHDHILLLFLFRALGFRLLRLLTSDLSIFSFGGLDFSFW
jgi:hypothetical protein